jgi:hypothetical protein
LARPERAVAGADIAGSGTSGSKRPDSLDINPAFGLNVKLLVPEPCIEIVIKIVYNRRLFQNFSLWNSLIFQ